MKDRYVAPMSRLNDDVPLDVRRKAFEDASPKPTQRALDDLAKRAARQPGGEEHILIARFWGGEAKEIRKIMRQRQITKRQFFQAAVRMYLDSFGLRV